MDGRPDIAKTRAYTSVDSSTHLLGMQCESVMCPHRCRVAKSSSTVAQAVNPDIFSTNDTLSIFHWVQQHIDGSGIPKQPAISQIIRVRVV